jgi:thiamine-monophosphate kinase
VIYEDRLPLSAAALAGKDPLAAALHDGEDFELLFTVSQEDGRKLEACWGQQSQTRLSVIGIIEPQKEEWESGIVLVRRDGGKELVWAGGWEHFRG